jgi:hypothetical protein
MQRSGSTALTPVLISFLSITAFLAVMWFAMMGDQPSSNTNTGSNTNVATNTDVSSVNDDRILVTNSSVNTNTSTNANIATNTNTTTDPTAGWETYTNAIYQYSIKYPDSYRVTPTPNDPETILIESGEAGYAGYYFITIGVIKANETNPDDLDNLLAWAKKGFPKDDPITIYHANPRNITLGDLTFVMTDGDTASSATPEYLILHNDTLFRIGSYPRLSQEVNQTIIATFAFLD